MMEALWKMKKLDMDKLLAAFNQYDFGGDALQNCRVYTFSAWMLHLILSSIETDNQLL